MMALAMPLANIRNGFMHDVVLAKDAIHLYTFSPIELEW
jgi:hypothetical protein